RGITGQRGLDSGEAGRVIFTVGNNNSLSTRVVEDTCNAFAVCAVVGDEHFRASGYKRANSRFNCESAASLQRYSDRVAVLIDDRHEVATDRRGELVECAIPRSPIAEHGGLCFRGRCQRAGCQKNRAGHVLYVSLLDVDSSIAPAPGRAWQRSPAP